MITEFGTMSILAAALCITIGSIGPAIAEGIALSRALAAIAQQPDEANRITLTQFGGLDKVESTAIYCFVVTMILIFANPFWDYAISKAGGN